MPRVAHPAQFRLACDERLSIRGFETLIVNLSQRFVLHMSIVRCGVTIAVLVTLLEPRLGLAASSAASKEAKTALHEALRTINPSREAKKPDAHSVQNYAGST